MMKEKNQGSEANLAHLWACLSVLDDQLCDEVKDCTQICNLLILDT